MKTLISFLLCSIFLLSLSLTAQIIYTDITPDTILTFPQIPQQEGAVSNFYDFDVNNDSIIDLTFKLRVSKSLFEGMYRIIKTEYIEPNIIIEDNSCMKVLVQYDTIDVNQLWSGGALISGYDYFIQNKIWFCNPENTSKYCGFNLVSNGNNYYGWIKMSWGGNYVKIHEFAYNATPEEIILAGQTESAGIDNFHQSDVYTITHYAGKLEITSDLLNHKIDKVRLIGITGKCIKDLEINNYKASINTIDIPVGFYIVQIVQSDNIIVQKVFISNN